MRVLHVIEGVDTERGGLPAALELILRMEQRLAIEHHVLSIKPPADRRIKRLGLPESNLHLLAPSFPARFYNSSAALSWLEEHGTSFDLIVIHGIWYILGVRSARWALSRKTPYIVWPHGSLKPYDLKKKRLLKKILGPSIIRDVLKNAVAVACTSEMEKENLVTYGITPNLEVLPFAVDYEPPTTEEAEIRNHGLPIADDDFVFLFMSRIHPVKRIDLVLKAFAEQKAKSSGVKLVIAGSYYTEDYQREVSALITELGIEQDVIQTGWIDHLKKYAIIRRSDCFLLPSMGDNFGIIVIESLKCGVPVIISPHVFIWKPIIEAGAGLLCETTVESLSGSMQTLWEQPEVHAKLKGNSQKAADVFSSTKLEAKYRSFYEKYAKGAAVQDVPA